MDASGTDQERYLLLKDLIEDLSGFSSHEQGKVHSETEKDGNLTPCCNSLIS